MRGREPPPGPAGSTPGTCPAHSTSTPRSYDRWSGPTRATTSTCGCPRSGWACPRPGAGLRLLDLGCGTGASTAALLDAAPEAEIIAVDASAEMLAPGPRARTGRTRVRFVHGDAVNLAAAGVHGPFDGILAAYLLRNLRRRRTPRCARSTTCCGPGAPLALHEYSVRDSARSRAVWTARLLVGDHPDGAGPRTGSSGLYRYLWRSVLQFDGVRRSAQRLRARRLRRRAGARPSRAGSSTSCTPSSAAARSSRMRRNRRASATTRPPHRPAWT